MLLDSVAANELITTSEDLADVKKHVEELRALATSARFTLPSRPDAREPPEFKDWLVVIEDRIEFHERLAAGEPPAAGPKARETSDDHFNAWNIAGQVLQGGAEFGDVDLTEVQDNRLLRLQSLLKGGSSLETVYSESPVEGARQDRSPQ